MIGVYGPRARDLLARVLEGEASELPEDEFREARFADAPVLVAGTREAGGEEGFDLFAPAASLPPLSEALLAHGAELGAKLVGFAALETLRIEAGRPRYGREFTEDTIPTEAFESTGLMSRAISFHKGCYTGQEVIVRIAHRGHVNRLLRGLLLGDAPVPAAAAPLFHSETGKQVGVGDELHPLAPRGADGGARLPAPRAGSGRSGSDRHRGRSRGRGGRAPVSAVGRRSGELGDDPEGASRACPRGRAPPPLSTALPQARVLRRREVVPRRQPEEEALGGEGSRETAARSRFRGGRQGKRGCNVARAGCRDRNRGAATPDGERLVQMGLRRLNPGCPRRLRVPAIKPRRPRRLSRMVPEWPPLCAVRHTYRRRRGPPSRRCGGKRSGGVSDAAP